MRKAIDILGISKVTDLFVKYYCLDSQENFGTLKRVFGEGTDLDDTTILLKLEEVLKRRL